MTPSGIEPLAYREKYIFLTSETAGWKYFASFFGLFATNGIAQG
jgi:hypothetical protein